VQKTNYYYSRFAFTRTGGENMKTQNVFLLFFALLAFTLMVNCEKAEKAEQQMPEKPSIERTSEYSIHAVVDKVDYEKRSVTLRDEEGVAHTFQNIHPDVPLEKLTIGKGVTMTISKKELNYAVKEGEEVPADEEVRTIGAKTGQEDRTITIIQAQNMTTTVKEVDAVNRMITLLMEDGTPMMLPVQDDVENLENLEPGDKVVSQATQVIMITIDE